MMDPNLAVVALAVVAMMGISAIATIVAGQGSSLRDRRGEPSAADLAEIIAAAQTTDQVGGTHQQ